MSANGSHAFFSLKILTTFAVSIVRNFVIIHAELMQVFRLFELFYSSSVSMY